MNWEKMTAPEFKESLQSSAGVCLLPLGVIEKHGDHLPLGQDTIYIHEVCTRAAEAEPAVVFPHYYIGQIAEARHVPGTISLPPHLVLALLEETCNEIGRNGFSKILLVNGHGGNINMLRYFLFTLLSKERKYAVYLSDLDYPAPKSKAVAESKVDGHAGEHETCSMLYLHPELVRIDAYGSYGEPLERTKALKERRIQTGIWWYADFPGHFAGQRTNLTAEKGKVFVEEHVAALVEQIRAVKNDSAAPALFEEFYGRSSKPDNRYP